MYDETFYQSLNQANASAEIIVAALNELLQPASVIDVGCGTGTWLAAFAKHGLTDLLGVEGEWASKASLHIPQHQLITHDLNQPLTIVRGFDLAMSIEVAEHLSEASGEMLVETLTKLSSVVVFSAAVPSQGGTHHINEQWQEHWVEKFMRRGFIPLLTIRRMFWSDPRVWAIYPQNIILYIRQENLTKYPSVAADYNESSGYKDFSVVHPHVYQKRIKYPLSDKINKKYYISLFPRILSAFVRNRLGCR